MLCAGCDNYVARACRGDQGGESMVESSGVSRQNRITNTIAVFLVVLVSFIRKTSSATLSLLIGWDLQQYCNIKTHVLSQSACPIESWL